MNTAVHAIRDKEFSFRISQQDGACVILHITVGECEHLVFLHGGKGEKALVDIDNAIRAFMMEGEIE